jgi:hypothetical protein
MAVIAYHLIWTNYGTWAPNDLRGSGSHEVYMPTLAELGSAHLGRKKNQPSRSSVRQFYEQAERRLQFPVIRFAAADQGVVAGGFAEAISREQFTCYACAIMPDHVHLVVRKHRLHAEQMIEILQTASADRLRFSSLVPADHPVWTKGGWKVFLDSPEAVWSRIRYVEGNPFKAGLPMQSWPFVVAYDNWPFHKRRS